MMNSVRRPAAVGMFYPADTDELTRLVDRLLAHTSAKNGTPKAVIAPHAGYVYSGPVAASAYACLASARHTISRVVLLGPSHRVAFHGLAASSAGYFATPLGLVPLDQNAIAEVMRLPQVRVLDEAHVAEHSLEVHLPFLQRLLPSFKLIPLVVGEASPAEVSEVLEYLWGGPETLVIVSSDLSHYHDYDSARAMDESTSRAIEALQPENIGYEQACGCNPVRGLLRSAAQHHLKARLIDLRNSGDTVGPKDRVVGYGAYVFQ